jgi:hypothetical protein
MTGAAFHNQPNMEDFTMKLNSKTGATLSAATVIALMSATPVAPAQAQTGTAPAGLLRLDPPQPSNDGAKLAEGARAKVRNAYALSLSRKTRPNR